jgi:leucine dehydrogenase
MSTFTHPEFDGHEQVSFFHDAATGLRAVIAVHNTALGPALGGCRMWAYESEEHAVRDVLRLSRGMTYKAAAARLPLGGGKSVIIGDSRKIKTEAMMRAMGKAVDAMGGRYIVAEDVGTTVADMTAVSLETAHVCGVQHDAGVGGDPSPVTAFGVYTGMKSAVKARLGIHSLRGLNVAVQGLGNVGYNLCRLLHADGANLFVTDVQADRIDAAAKEFGATPVSLEGIYAVDAHIFAPCALGAILNDDTIPRLKARVVAGAANNQLENARHGDLLQHMRILYAPDYVINAGGLINVYYEYAANQQGKPVTHEAVMAHVATIAETTEAVFRKAEQEGIPTALAADRVAEQRFKTPTPPSPLHACA